MNTAVLEQAARLYGIQPSDLQSLTGGHFSYVFEFIQNGKERVLRITPPNQDVDLLSINAILAWMDYLGKHGAAVTRPVPSSSGNLIEVITLDSDQFLCVVYEKVHGELAETLSFDQWNSQLFEDLGRAVGRMHALAKRYRPIDAALTRPEWDQIGNCFNPINRLDSSQADILKRKTEMIGFIQALPKHPGDYGLIHSDLHLGNIMVDLPANRVTILDFDDCCQGWYAMDIAMTLFDILVVYPVADKPRFAKQFLEEYLIGYRQETDLSQFSIESLPHFLKLLEIGTYTQVYRSYASDQADAWIEKFMVGRRERIGQGIPYVELDFESFSI
jgi:Ser/Thr protein kinase RdoA (MazF antagonist)